MYPKNIAHFLIFYRTLSDGLYKWHISEHELFDTLFLTLKVEKHVKEGWFAFFNLFSPQVALEGLKSKVL